MICAPPMIVRISEAWPGQSTCSRQSLARVRLPLLNSYHGCSFIFSESQGQTSGDSHQRELHRVIFRCSRLDVRWEWDNERGESQVERDSSFLCVV
jgi:hypothetical protein